ncbi:hypothetical protein BDR05DRAFT_947920 [Suillus weaverae]|nr:hypothetical protein BDR05DRAFT_947920 [Suillus weaverae]
MSLCTSIMGLHFIWIHVKGILQLKELQDTPVKDYPPDWVKGPLSAVLEWLVPRGQVIILPLSQNIKSDHGFNHEVTGALLCPTGLNWSNVETKQSFKSGKTSVCGDQWSMFLYACYVYDPEDLWKGLLRSKILIFINSFY